MVMWLEKGKSGSFNCLSHTMPMWTFKNSFKLPINVIQENNKLSIKNIQESNEGEYECRGESAELEPFYAKAQLFVGKYLSTGSNLLLKIVF